MCGRAVSGGRGLSLCLPLLYAALFPHLFLSNKRKSQDRIIDCYVLYYKKDLQFPRELQVKWKEEVVPPGFEPGTHGFSVRCSTNWAMAPSFVHNFKASFAHALEVFLNCVCKGTAFFCTVQIFPDISSKKYHNLWFCASFGKEVGYQTWGNRIFETSCSLALKIGWAR